MTREWEVVAVPEERWKAQEWESSVWTRANEKNSWLKLTAKFVRAARKPSQLVELLRYRDFYRGDDWNFWWLKAFENYKALPKNVTKALEVGCGPFTNMRLISKTCKVKEIYCSDPLIEAYSKFRLTWLATQMAKNRLKAVRAKGEELDFADEYFDLVVCINVLDHVQDSRRCVEQVLRVTKGGGYVVLGQDLCNDEDLTDIQLRTHVGHPIKLHEATLNTMLGSSCESLLRKILPRHNGRDPSAHYGTLIFIGRKK
jgi:SAM-dependent methyltransferase